MTDRYILVLDAGATAVRCFAFDSKGQIASSRRMTWPLLEPAGPITLAQEFDCGTLWKDLYGLVKNTIHDAGVKAGNIAAITATSQRQAVVFLDVAGVEVYAGPNLDLRAVFEGGGIDEEMGDRVYDVTGHAPTFLLVPAKLRWFQRNRPDAYDRIATVLPLGDWLLWKMSNNLVSETTLAGACGLLDVRKRQWCADLFDGLGLVGNNDVALGSAGVVVGRIGEKVSSETGLRVGTPVALAGADTQCGLLGMGVVDKGQVGIVAGWSSPVQIIVDLPIFAPLIKTWVGCYLTADKWVVESNSGDTGNSYQWLAETLWSGRENALEQMEAEARVVPAGSEEVQAFLGHRRMDMSRLGLTQGGFLFPVPVTVAAPGRGHLARAALESLAYATRANLDQVEQIAGVDAKYVALGGGMTKTATWVDILANVVGRQIAVSPTSNVSAIGAYLCASTAIGEFGSLVEAVGSVRGNMRPVEPDHALSSEYQDYYERWTATLEQLEKVSP